MTIVLGENGPFLQQPLSNYPVAVPPPGPPVTGPGVGETFSAGFFLESAPAAVLRGVRFKRAAEELGGLPPDPGYNLATDPRLQGNLALQEMLLGSDSFEETSLRLMEIRSLQESQQTIDAAGGLGTFAAVAGSLVNWDVLIPISKIGAATRLMGAGKIAGYSLALSVPQEAVISQNTPTRTNAESLMAIGMITAAGGILGLAKKPTIRAGQTADLGTGAKANVDETQVGAKAYEMDAPRSTGVGAEEVENASFRKSYAEQLREEGLKETGTGLEKVFEPMFPVMRMLGAGSVLAREVVGELVDLGGLIKAKNVPNADRAAEATRASVETEHRAKWLYPLVQGIRLQDRAYLRYLGAKPTGGFGDFITANRGVPGKLSQKQFRTEVGKALARGDMHDIPEVAAAAKMWRRQVYKPMQDAAVESGVFARPLEKEMEKLQKMAEKLKGSGKPPSKAQQAEAIQIKAEMDTLQSRIDKLQSEGPSFNNGASYFPRVYKVADIMGRRSEFENILFRWLKTTFDEGTAPADNVLRKQAQEISETIVNGKPYMEIGKDDLIQPAGALRERTLDIPDDLIEDFLERDVEVVSRYVQQSVTRDIELTRRFGDVSMKEQLDAIADEYDELIAKAGGKRLLDLVDEKLARMKDLRALRDRYRGTYGVPQDPMRLVSRAARMAKTFNVLTMMGGATISSIPDISRVVMTEGFQRAYGTAAAHLWGEHRKTLRSMSRKEANRAGVALDMVLGLRALQMADISDVMGRRSQLESALFQGANMMFLANGLNLWNTAMKEWAATAISDRVLEAAGQLARGKASKISETKLARSGIDADMAARIQAMAKTHGETIDGVRMPNTSAWTDLGAAKAFREAISQDVERTILTPGAGDRALWTSTEFGSLVAQFQSFGQATIPRTIISGLQEHEISMLQGVLLAVALGGAVEESKRWLRGDDSPRTSGEIVVNAVDRSGVTGMVMNINSVVDNVSNGQVSLQALAGQTPRGAGVDLEPLIGPTGSNLELIGNLTADLLRGDLDAGTMGTARRLIPGQNLPQVQATERLLGEP